MTNTPKPTPSNGCEQFSTQVPNQENDELQPVNSQTGEKGVETGPPPPIKSQAETLFEKFGNASRLHACLNALKRPYNKATLYKWTYPRSKGGTGGWVPTSAWPDVLAAARYYGVLITSEEMDPRSYLPKKRFI